MKKNTLFSAVLWCVAGVITFTFLILPDFVSSDFVSIDSANLFLRAFFTFFLCNPLIGSARAFNNPALVNNFASKYPNSDRESLVISIYFSGVVFTIVPAIVFILALSTFYPLLGWLKYLFFMLYLALITVLQHFFSKIKLEQVRSKN